MFNKLIFALVASFAIEGIHALNKYTNLHKELLSHKEFDDDLMNKLLMGERVPKVNHLLYDDALILMDKMV